MILFNLDFFEMSDKPISVQNDSRETKYIKVVSLLFLWC